MHQAHQYKLTRFATRTLAACVLCLVAFAPDPNTPGCEAQEISESNSAAQKNRRAGNNANRPAGRVQGANLVIPKGVKFVADIAYREGSPACKLDLAMPENVGDEKRPAIVFVHGGGWRSGDKRAGYFLKGALDYAQKGYVCITVNYRMLDEAKINTCVEDVKCAVRWLRAHADEYHVDSDRIGAFGNSAGAHLVSMLGLVGPDAKLEGDGPWQDQSSKVQAVCAAATPADFMNWGNPGSANRNSDAIFGQPEANPDVLKKRMSPISYVTKDAPPFLLVHGTKDTTVPYSQGESFAAALRKAGNTDVTLITVEGAGHGVFVQHANETQPAMEKFFARVLKM